MGDALALAPEPEGYPRLFLDEGAPALELLRGRSRRARRRPPTGPRAAAATTGSATTPPPAHSAPGRWPTR